MPTFSPVYTSPLLAYFDFAHLPPWLQDVSSSYARLAVASHKAMVTELEIYAVKQRAVQVKAAPAMREEIEAMPAHMFVDLAALPPNLKAALNQTEAALAKLLEAKDCAVRAALSIVKAAKECEHTPPLRVTVNGEQLSFTKDRLEYSELVASANMSGNPSITVRRPNGSGHCFLPGQTLDLEPGMVINLAHTGNA